MCKNLEKNKKKTQIEVKSPSYGLDHLKELNDTEKV